MGYSLAWIATAAPAEIVHPLLGLKPSGARAELAEAPIVGAALSGGWYLVAADGCEHPLISDRVLALVSAKLDVVACWVEEHIMFSRAAWWSSGQEIWSVEHDAQQAVEHLQLHGELPAFAAPLQAQALAEQSADGGAASEIDFVFDVPLLIAQRLTGYKHDEAGEPEHFNQLAPTKGSPLARKPFWKLW